MRKLASFDLVVLGYFGILTAMVLAVRPPGTALYLGAHASVAGLLALVVAAHARFGGRFWTFCRYWYIVPVVLGSFRELHFLIPAIHPFDDHRMDRALAAIDRRWFGDVDAFFLGLLRPGLTDLLHVCYWFYFVSMLVPGGVLYARGELAKLREYTSVVLSGMYVSYLGYFAVPAVGPHHFFESRPAVLDGWIGGTMHRLLLDLELRTADAFPSGHALMSMIVIGLAWRFTPGATFRAVLVPALGCIVATVALRYHYLVDVLASAALLPGVFWLGRAVHRVWEAAPRGGAGGGPAGFRIPDSGFRPPTSSPPR